MLGRVREHLTRTRLLVAVPALLALLLLGGNRAEHAFLTTLSCLGLLGAGAGLLLCWRVTGSGATRQVGAGLLVLGLHIPVRFTVGATLDARWPHLSTVAELAVVLAAAAVTLRAVAGDGRLRGPRPPVAVGAAAGATAVGALCSGTPSVVTGCLAATALLAGAMWALVCAATWRRLRTGAVTVSSPRTLAAIALTLAVLTAARALPVLAPGAGAGLQVVLDLGLLAAAAVAASTALRRISDALSGQERYVAALLEQLAGHERQLQQARACLHDARAATAGVRACSSAVQHLSLPDDAPLRAELEESVHLELGRLERMLRLPDRRPTVGAVDLDALVRPLVVSHRERGLQVEWAPRGGEPVTVDGDALVVVLGNLLGNALVHAPGALCRVDVTVDDVLTVTVSDDGPGVDPAIRPRVYQAGISRPGSPGEGLGLAISRDLVRRSGGDLTEGARDRGACFVLTLPRHAATLVAPLPAAIPVPLGELAPAR